MTLLNVIKHAFISPKPDGADATVVRPSNWNANHSVQFECAGNTILGRGGTSQGPVQELALDGVFDVSGDGVLSITSLIPVGVVLDFGGSTAPNGWHLCDGALLLRDDYVALFAAIGETFGEGDGFSTFAVPDLRGRATFGRDGMGGTAANRIDSTALDGTSDGTSTSSNHVGAYGGAQVVALTTAELPPHDHTFDELLPGETGPGTHSHRIANASTTGGSATATPDNHLSYKNTGGVPYELSESGGSPTLLKTGDDGGHTHTLGMAGAGDAHMNLPPMMIVTKIIFTGVFT